MTMPAPRLQLRWEKRAEPHWLDKSPESIYEAVGSATVKANESFQCVYEMVLPLGELDIRRTQYGSEGNELDEERTELVFPIGNGKTIRGANGRIPCYDKDGNFFADTPFRDHAHALWDSKALNGIPIFVVSHKGDFAEIKDVQNT